MTEAQRHQILLEMLAQLGFVTVEKVVERLGIAVHQHYLDLPLRDAISINLTKAAN